MCYNKNCVSTGSVLIIVFLIADLRAMFMHRLLYTSPASHSCGQIIATVWLISLQSDYRAFHYVDWSKESFRCIDQTSKQAHFTSCGQQNWIFVRGFEVQRNTGCVFVETCTREKILETCHSKFVCRIRAFLISSKSTVQGLVDKFLTG